MTYSPLNVRLAKMLVKAALGQPIIPQHARDILLKMEGAGMTTDGFVYAEVDQVNARPERPVK